MKLLNALTSTLAILAVSLPAALFAAGASAIPAIPECQGGRPDVFQDIRSPLAMSALPSAVMIARTADVWIENKNSGLKIWARHNFKSGQKSFVCANIPAASSTHLSVPLVVLHDRSRNSKVGDSLWQFQIMARNGKMGLWNQKSGIMTVKDFLNTRSAQWKPEFDSTLLDEPILRASHSSLGTDSISVIRYDLENP